MVRCSSRTIRSPRSSKRWTIAPTRPRRTASGLSRTRVRWPDGPDDADGADMGRTLVRGRPATDGQVLAQEPVGAFPRQCRGAGVVAEEVVGVEGVGRTL